MYESETTGGAEPRLRRYSSDWGSVSLSRGGSRAGSPHGAAPDHPNAGPPFKSHSSDDIGSSWMRTVESVNSGAQSVASDWAEYDGGDSGLFRPAHNKICGQLLPMVCREGGGCVIILKEIGAHPISVM